MGWAQGLGVMSGGMCSTDSDCGGRAMRGRRRAVRSAPHQLDVVDVKANAGAEPARHHAEPLRPAHTQPPPPPPPPPPLLLLLLLTERGSGVATAGV